jgi:DNA-binding SARP family transcriptional activator
VDAPAFEADVSEGNRALETDPQAAARRYRRALALYRGDFLPERRYEDWTSPRRERLQTLMLGTLVKLADLQVAGTPLEAIRLAERALEVDRAWEDAYRTLMRAYLQTGNRPLALRAYERCVAVLQEEFQIPPLPETQALYEQIRGRG